MFADALAKAILGGQNTLVIPSFLSAVGTFVHAALLPLLLSTGCVGGVPQSPASPLPANSTFEDSPSGLQQQFQTFLQIIRSGDQTAVQSFLDGFAIPEPAPWFGSHFDPALAPKLADDYAKAFDGMRSHIWWATGTFSKFPDFSYAVQSSAVPAPIADEGFESLLPRPMTPIQIENFRISSTSSDSSHGPPSWVSSFVYAEGRFRWVGGTYPFWAEGLNALRGPMSLAPTSINGRTVQAIAFRNDKKGPAINGLVQVEVKVERDGHVSKIRFLSGDRELLEDARAYLSAHSFPPLPNDPRLVNAERRWKMEVAFFAPRN
ncbi:MAG TPA: hypothetical protein VE077_11900 [Candidatus Methylomirabilis sp.]|nr:hypothetical protein [Candidatus Methylomirabilis sp.]